MNIPFSYEEPSSYFDHYLIAKTSDGLEIKIGFKGFEAEYIYISEHEMEVASDDYKGLYVNFGHGLEMKIIPIASVIQQANAQIDFIVAEVEAEQRDWDRHVASFSQAQL